MSTRFEPTPPPRPRPGSPPLPSSQRGYQTPSEGPRLTKSIPLYLSYIWIISSAEKTGRFTPHAAKVPLVESLAKAIGGEEGISPADKVFIETQLAHFIFEKLKQLAAILQKAPVYKEHLLKTYRERPKKFKEAVEGILRKESEGEE